MGPLLTPIKGRSRALVQKGLATRENGLPDSLSLSLSLADACNPLLQAHPTWAQDNTKAAGFPFAYFFPPSCSVSRRPIWAGTRGDNLLVGLGTPRVETPTVGAPGRGLLRVDEQLPVKLQMGSLQQPLQPRTMLRFGSLEFMSSPRGGRATSGTVPSPSPPTEEEAGQAWPSRRRHLVGCRASRRRRRPSGGHVGCRPRV
jgi:hypothetical protein